MKDKKRKQSGNSLKGFISDEARYVLIGLLIFLLSFIGIIESGGYLGSVISFVFIYLFGVFYFIPLILFAAYGIYIFLRRKNPDFEVGPYLIALAFVIFFALIWASVFSVENGNYLSSVFGEYSSRFNQIRGKGLTVIVGQGKSGVGGGIVGFFFFAVLAELMSPVGASVVYIIGFILSLVFLLRPFVELIVRWVNKRRKNYQRKEKPKRVNKHYEYIAETKTAAAPKPVENPQSAESIAIKQEEEMISRIKVEDSSNYNPSKAFVPQATNSVFQDVFVEDNDPLKSNGMSKQKTFNVFTDSLTDFDEQEVKEEVQPKQTIKGFNVFTDSLGFDDFANPTPQRHEEEETHSSVYLQKEATPVVTEKVYDISDMDLYGTRQKETVTQAEEKTVVVDNTEPAPENTLNSLNMFKREMTYAEPEPQPQPTAETKPAEEVAEKPTIRRIPKVYHLPSAGLLNEVSYTDMTENKMQADIKAVQLNNKLASLGIKGKVKDYTVAPAFTRFEVDVNSDVKVNQFSQVRNDLMMALSAAQINILAPIPGSPYVGIDIPNVKRASVSFKECFVGLPFEKKDNKLLTAIGKDIIGRVVSIPLDETPHMLVAGATGSGKSICLNTIIVSLIMRATPDEVRIVLVDPKRVEFNSYMSIPHLLCPVITDAKRAAVALRKLCDEMERRYSLLQQSGKKNIQLYNNYVRSTGGDPLPYIVVIVDELGDLMTVAKAEVEDSVRRITQLARAAGIHLIVATQRPSVDVITGVIKANIPSRVAFAVSSNQDSRTILDESGAEELLGKGDMLMRLSGQYNTTRVQGCFVSDEEIDKVVEFVKSQREPDYDPNFLDLDPPEPEQMNFGDEIGEDNYGSAEDETYKKILSWLKGQSGVSTSLLQRVFYLGYPRAARIIDRLYQEGYIGAPSGSKPREIFYDHLLDDDTGE